MLPLPFQGYFPQKEYEHEIGQDGTTHLALIPNNIVPETPNIDANILFMYIRDESWHDRETRKQKSSSLRHIVQLTLSKDFMKEGRNHLALIVSRTDNKADENISTVGEDITQKTDTPALNLTDLIDFDNDGLVVFKKYLETTLPTKIKLNEIEYGVINLVPFYNATLEKM